MENERIKVGDVVSIKSGGSRMTVEKITGDSVECAWFEKDQSNGVSDLRRAIFNSDSLAKET